jgi:branched-chain amino acid transport system substrate-binding protein
VLLTGERRIGKTSFLHALERELDHVGDASWRWVPCYTSLENVPEERFYTTLIGSLLEKVRGELPPDLKLRHTPETDSHPASTSYHFRWFLQDLKAVADALGAAGKKPVKLVLLIDEIDRLNAYGSAIKYDLRTLFQSPYLEDRVRFVLTGFHLDESVPPDATSPPFNYLARRTMASLEEPEARSLIETPAWGFYRYEPAAVRRIIELSAGRPFVIQALCLRLIDHILDQKRRTVTAADLDAVQAPVLEEIRRIMDPGSSQETLASSMTELLRRNTELEREVAALRARLAGSADGSPAPPDTAAVEGTG